MTNMASKCHQHQRVIMINIPSACHQHRHFIMINMSSTCHQHVINTSPTATCHHDQRVIDKSSTSTFHHDQHAATFATTATATAAATAAAAAATATATVATTATAADFRRVPMVCACAHRYHSRGHGGACNKQKICTHVQNGRYVAVEVHFPAGCHMQRQLYESQCIPQLCQSALLGRIIPRARVFFSHRINRRGFRLAPLQIYVSQ